MLNETMHEDRWLDIKFEPVNLTLREEYALMKEVILAVLTGGVGLEILRRAFRWFDLYLKKQKPVTTTAKFNADLYEILYEIRDNTPADRVMIFKTVNGGGKPRPGYPLYIMLDHEVLPKSNRPSLKSVYDKLEVDVHYNQMLATLDAAPRYHHYRREELPEDSLLRAIMESNDLNETLVGYVYEGSTLWYCSFPTQGVYTESDIRKFVIYQRRLTALYRQHVT